MPHIINMRGVAVEDSSITSDMLATGAVDLSTVKVTGQLPETKLADNAVTSNKIAASAVVAAKIADSAIDLTGLKITGILPLGKSHPDLKADLVIGNDSAVSVTGTTETEVKNARFVLDAVGIKSKNKLIVAVGLFTGNITHTTSAKFFVDAESTARLTLTSVSLTEELKTGDFSVSDLANGIHTVKIKLVSSNAAGLASMKVTEVYHVV